MPGMALHFYSLSLRRSRSAPAGGPRAARDDGYGVDEGAGLDADGLVYRLRCWPPLPAPCRTARVFRVLDRMSRRPVSEQWLDACSGLTPVQVDELILNLVVQRAVDVSEGRPSARR